MRFLRNPIVSGILAVVAVLVLAYQFTGGAMARYRPAGITKRLVSELVSATAPAPIPTPPPAPVTQLEEAPVSPADPIIDRSYLEGRFAKWVASPLRDPFLLFSADPKDKKDDEEFQSPISKWHLNGIWDQTGGKLAVINKRVHRVGDEIEGYKIVKIEGEEVWFQGPKRKERLALEKRGPSIVQNPVFLPAPTQPSTVPQ
jgi:hypothetical protein